MVMQLAGVFLYSGFEDSKAGLNVRDVDVTLAWYFSAGYRTKAELTVSLSTFLSSINSTRV